MANNLEMGLSESIFANLIIFGTSKNAQILKHLKDSPEVMKLEEKGGRGEEGVEEWQVQLPEEEVLFHFISFIIYLFTIFLLFSFSFFLIPFLPSIKKRLTVTSSETFLVT